MRVSGSTPTTPAAERQVARPAADGFAPEAGSEAGAPSATVHAGAAAALGSLEALLTLQETSTPLERRRRAVRRAGRILDALDELRIAVLDPSSLDQSALQRLAGAVREARDEVEDPALGGVLDEIETRAAVELAKREMKRAA
jgi:hypothetical protein